MIYLGSKIAVKHELRNGANLQSVRKERNDEGACTDVDFVAESSAERIRGRRKESTDVTHTADLEPVSYTHLTLPTKRIV